jgi:hypothetical protein
MSPLRPAFFVRGTYRLPIATAQFLSNGTEHVALCLVASVFFRPYFGLGGILVIKLSIVRSNGGGNAAAS